jgi:hypothetical protein
MPFLDYLGVPEVSWSTLVFNLVLKAGTIQIFVCLADQWAP